MASIHKVGSSYQCFFRFGGAQFKPSLKTSNEKEALGRKAAIEETIRLLETGRLALPSDATREEVLQFILSGGKLTEKPKLNGKALTLAAVFTDYFKATVSGKEDSTVRGERTHAKHFERLIGADTRFDQINADALREYADKRVNEKGHRGKSVSPQTVAKEFRTWSQVWNYSRKQGLVPGTSPHKDVRLQRPDQSAPFMTWKEIETIIKRGKVSDADQRQYWDCLFLDEQQVLELVEFVGKNGPAFLHAAVATAAFTGARRSEIIRSRIEDWDFERGIVRIRGRKDSRTVRTTLRDVAIHPKLAAILKAWFKQHPGGTHTIIAPARNGEPSPMSADQAHHSLKSCLSDSKWSVIRGWHVLRHSFCSNCARRGVPDLIIDRWMGHQGDEAVKQRYRHLFPQDAAEFMQKLFC